MTIRAALGSDHWTDPLPRHALIKLNGQWTRVRCACSPTALCGVHADQYRQHHLKEQPVNITTFSSPTGPIDAVTTQINADLWTAPLPRHALAQVDGRWTRVPCPCSTTELCEYHGAQAKRIDLGDPVNAQIFGAAAVAAARAATA